MTDGWRAARISVFAQAHTTSRVFSSRVALALCRTLNPGFLSHATRYRFAVTRLRSDFGLP